MARQDAHQSDRFPAEQNAGEQVNTNERRRQRFFIPGPLRPDTTVGVDELAQQLAQVLRMQAGEELVLLDGSGLEYRCRLAHLDRRSATVQVLTAQPCPGEPQAYLTLYQCSLKQDKFEWVLQKGTELGVSRFVPVISERSIVRPAEALLRKYDRWRAIVREAAEQCGRGRIPELAEPLDWQLAVTGAQGMRLLPWEAPQPMPALWAFLQHSMQSDTCLSILIGPEGGISQQEAHLAVMHGWQLVSLGPRILRAETAALAAVAITLARS
jgi:16S rRNA (uracil1498-N3)-methyltransferase